MPRRIPQPAELPAFNADADYLVTHEAPRGRCAACGQRGERMWAVRAWVAGSVRYGVCRGCLSLLRARPLF